VTTAAVSAGEALARSIAAGDRAALVRLLAPQLDFKAVTPSRAWEAGTAEEVADIVLGRWFGGDRHITSVEHIDTDSVADCERVGYRFRATTPDGEAVVEQQAYIGAADGAITSLRIACSGFRPVAS